MTKTPTVAIQKCGFLRGSCQTTFCLAAVANTDLRMHGTSMVIQYGHKGSAVYGHHPFPVRHHKREGRPNAYDKKEKCRIQYCLRFD
jgi:hypothetical protein